jgi:hypothetical protein
MNTSEQPPDGVYFRNSPNWGDTSRTYGLGVFMNERVQLECFTSGQAIGPYNDSLWYYVLNVTRPVNYNGAPNQGMLNAHYINDGQNANIVDAGVPACVNNLPPTSPQPPPPPNPRVSLSQGPAAPHGWWYAISVANFSPNTGISVSCFDSVSTGGFRTFTLNTDGGGQGSTQAQCYSGDGPDHWVVANGVGSNHVSWTVAPPAQQGTPGGGGSASGHLNDPGSGTQTTPAPSTAPRSDLRPTGAVPFPRLPATDQLPVQPRPSVLERAKYEGDLPEIQSLAKFCLSVQFYNCYNDIQHFVDATGMQRTVPMAQLFTDMSGLRGQFQYWLRDNVTKSIDQLKSTSPAEAVEVCFDTSGSIQNCSAGSTQKAQNWSPYDAAAYDSDWHWALGHFSIRMVGNVWIGPADESGRRPIQIQYRSFMFDVYNFGGDEFSNLEDLARHGMAADFLEEGESKTVTVTADLVSLNPQALDLSW